MPVYFHSEDIVFNLPEKQIFKNWLESVIEKNLRITGDINVIFSSKDNLLQINRQYLKHNFHTDVITFEYNEENMISGDIYIGVDTVRENSRHLNQPFLKEISRVMVHGILHLLGMEDNDDRGKELMRRKEDEALLELKNIGDGKII